MKEFNKQPTNPSFPQSSNSCTANHTLTMKFTIAVSALALAASSEAFSPLASPRSLSSALKMAEATETKTYTFAKSEEIFTEAKEVRRNAALRCSFHVAHLSFICRD